MSRKDRLAALFQQWTSGVLTCDVIAGLSLNVEEVVEAPRIPTLFDLGKSKITVAEITVPLGLEGWFAARQFGSEKDDAPEKFWAKRLFQSYAGSSANIQSVIRQLKRDSDSTSQVGIIATIGKGNQSRSLVAALDHANAQYALMSAEGTNVTVSLKANRGNSQVMICEKNGYTPPPRLLNLLRQADPRAAVFTGVRSQDISLVRGVFAAYHNKRAVRVFSPHVDLLADETRRAELREVIRGTNILALSEEEALALVASGGHFGADRPFDRKDPEHVEQLAHAVAAFGAQISAITMAEYGVVVIAGSTIIRHYGMRPPRGLRDQAGAGDAFLAALIYYYVLTNRLNNRRVNLKALERAIQRAVVVAAHKVSHIGSSSGIPSAVEVEKFLMKKNGKQKKQ